MKQLSLIIASTLILSSCSTIIGGFTPTSKSAGGIGPATIGNGDTTLNNDKFEALSIESGSLTINSVLILENLNVSNNVTATKLTVKGSSYIGGSLIDSNSSFNENCTVGNNISADKSYFAKNIEFAGTNLTLQNKSKVVGDIISTSTEPSTIVIDHSIVKGIIGFTNANSKVIIQNKGHLTGRVFNGKVEDLTGRDSYEGDDNDDFAESDIAIK